jgi:hypothetical protein
MERVSSVHVANDGDQVTDLPKDFLRQLDIHIIILAGELEIEFWKCDDFRDFLPGCKLVVDTPWVGGGVV